ncbi:MAG TPA: hypothetical protein VJO99_18845 [Burkholderiaceae bacterium]|nr:hypothetical protein [Burkholderiaceae bacterium]
MKNALRIGLLVLLAVLLPIRGAMAAAMLCPPALGAAQAQAHAAHEPAAHDHAQHHHVPSDATAHATSDDNTCNLCAAFCSATPLPSSAPTLPSPSDYTSTSFPELRAAAPSFVSGGPERPPRSI